MEATERRTVGSFETASLEKTTELTKLMASDVVYFHVSGPEENLLEPKYAESLRKRVTAATEKYAETLNAMADKLEPLSQETLPQSFHNIVEKMFSDGRYNWGRVVAVCAFAVVLARRFHKKRQDDLVGETARILGDYIACRLGVWIAQRGG